MRYWPLIAVLVILSLPELASASIINASIIDNSTGGLAEVFYTTDGKAYVDQVGGNQDFQLEVCADAASEIQNNVTSWAYKAGNSSDFVLIGEVGGTGANTSTLSICSGGCCRTSKTWNFKDSEAVYPGRIYAVVSQDDSIVEVDDAWIAILPSGNKNFLRGSYGINDVQSTFDQVTKKVQLTINSITGILSTSSSQEIYPGGTGINKKKIVVGICDTTVDIDAFKCADSNTTFPGVNNSLNTGVTPSESSAITRYALVNGIPNSFCIGPDLTVTSLNLDPDSVFQSETSILNATITNDNNVNVTTNFTVEFLRDGISIDNETVTEDLSPGESTNAAFSYDTTGLLSGDKTITARILDSDAGIADCNDGNDNETATLTVKKTYQVLVLINGTETTVFPRPGRPYNVTLHVNDSDGNDVPALVRITERNGINLFAPIQNLSAGKGVSSLAVAEFETDGGGDADIALIPTGNKLYEPEFAYLNVSSFVGSYSLYLELFNVTTEEELQLFNGTDIISQLNFTLTNLTSELPATVDENSIFVFNHNSFVQQVIDLANQVYSSIVKWTGVI